MIWSLRLKFLSIEAVLEIVNNHRDDGSLMQCKLIWVAEIQEPRKLLNNALWKKLKPLFPAKAGDVGTKGRDSRQLIDAVLWR